MSNVKPASADGAPPEIDCQLSLESTIEQLRHIQEAQCTRPWRIVIRTTNFGGLSAHQTTEIRGIYAGFDWEAGRVVLEPAKPLTELSPEQINAIVMSVRVGGSWHAHEREKKLRARITNLEAEVSQLRAAAAGQPQGQP